MLHSLFNHHHHQNSYHHHNRLRKLSLVTTMKGIITNMIKKNDPTVLTDAQIDLLLHETHFTREEIIEWHKGFLKDCPNGLLDRRKFSEIYRDLFPNGEHVEVYSDAVFRVFDADNNNQIDFVEFLIGTSICKSRNSTDVIKKIQLAFRMYDSDHNGRIEMREMEKMIMSIHMLLGDHNMTGENDPKVRVKKIFSKLDKDHDDTLTEKEFIDGCLNDNYLMTILVPSF